MASGFLSATVYPATHTHTKGDADGGLTVHLEARIVVARVAVALTLAVHACIRQHTSAYGMGHCRSEKTYGANSEEQY